MIFRPFEIPSLVVKLVHIYTIIEIEIVNYSQICYDIWQSDFLFFIFHYETWVNNPIKVKQSKLLEFVT